MCVATAATVATAEESAHCTLDVPSHPLRSATHLNIAAFTAWVT
jgi:hypothetical protein